MVTEALNASAAARRLGISTKALRLYEQRGLLTPGRTAAGYRLYGPAEIARAGEIASLRSLGLSLSQVSRVLAGDPQSVEQALAAHESVLATELQDLGTAISKVRSLRAELARGRSLAPIELGQLLRPLTRFDVCFDLPWPWGGERFELRDIRPLNYIVGPLGSGKTRLALRLSAALPGGAFLGLDRLDASGAITAAARLDADSALKLRVDRTLAWLVDEGATASEALTALLVGLEMEGPAVVVVDMVEQGLDEATQEALMAHLRQQAKADARPLFLMTRSTAILDLARVDIEESIIYCPANHSPPFCVSAIAGAPGYEAVATCLASPNVRARIAALP
jgi:DNA-binding transcriptional MerR regulator